MRNYFLGSLTVPGTDPVTFDFYPESLPGGVTGNNCKIVVETYSGTYTFTWDVQAYIAPDKSSPQIAVQQDIADGTMSGDVPLYGRIVVVVTATVNSESGDVRIWAAVED